MGAFESARAIRATSAADSSVIGKIPADNSVGRPSVDDKSVRDDESWFGETARSLLAPKPGLALHLLTAVDERSCHRYAAGDTTPREYLLRQLLRSKQGRSWLNAVMADSDAPWWCEMQRAERICAQVDKLNLD